MMRVSAPLRLLAAVALMACATACSSNGPAPTPTPDTDTITPVAERPSPDPRTPAPEGAVSAAALPGAADIAGRTPGTWTEKATFDHTPDHPSSGCQANGWESLGSDVVHLREYAGPDDATATVTVMSFRDPDLLKQAVTTMDKWWAGCRTMVESNGGQGGRPVGAAIDVPLPDVTARRGENRWTKDGKDVVESHATIVSGDRLAVVIQTDSAAVPEPAWKATLTKVAERLRA